MEYQTLENALDSKNTWLFDQQAELLINFYTMFMDFITKVIPFDEGLFAGMQAIGHPVVEACINKATCGPFQIYWENYYLNYNDGSFQ